MDPAIQLSLEGMNMAFGAELCKRWKRHTTRFIFGYYD